MKLSKNLAILGIVGVVGLIVGMLIWRELPKEPLDLSKEEAPFPAIHMPPQAVYASGYMDGGSIGVLIVDHSGTKHELHFPIDYQGIRNAHPTAFLGNINDRKRTELKNPARAKEIVIQLLTEFGKEFNDPRAEDSNHTANARRALSSPPYIVASRVFERAKRFLSY